MTLHDEALMKNRLIKMVIMICVASISCVAAASQETPISASAYHTAIWEGNAVAIWQKLQPLSSAKLTAMLANEKNPINQQWIQLALLSKKWSTNTKELARALIAWREQNPAHPANALLPSPDELKQLPLSEPPQHIAVLLPLTGSFAASGQKVRDGLIKAYYENMPKASKQSLRFYDTSPSTNISALYEKALEEGADFVIGPLVKSNVVQLKNVKTFAIPTLVLNYTDEASLASEHFYEFGLMPEDEALQMATRANQDGHVRAIIIAPENDWGKRLAATFSSRWQVLGGEITETWTFTSRTDFSRDIAHLMGINPDDHDKAHTQKRRQDFDVIFLFAQPTEARSIVPLLRFNDARDVAIYASSSLFAGKLNPEARADLSGVVVCDIPLNKINPAEAQQDFSANRLRAVGQDAYLLTQALPRLKQLPQFALYAATGALVLTPDQQIHRHLPCTTTSNGHL
jgi:outer membrane PBP1 activator LpoA protein